MDGLVFGEQPRWHDDRLSFSDWGTQEVIAIDMDGKSEVALRGDRFRCASIGYPTAGCWSSRRGRACFFARSPTARSRPTATLAARPPRRPVTNWSSTAAGTRTSTGAGFDLMAGEDFAPGIVALVAPDGAARQVADGLAFPNGMLIMPDDQTLIVAESYAKRLTAFDIATDGGLTNRRVWADSATGFRTASVPTPRTPSGTRTCRTSAACAFAKAARSCKRSSSTVGASRAPLAAGTERRCS